jgi:LysM domain
MSRGVVLRSLATSAVVALLVAAAVACVPQPAGRRTQPPVAASAAPATQVSPTPGPPTPSPSPSFSRPTATPQPTFFMYRVRSGDTITSIAKKHDTTARSIGYWNRATYPSLDPESSRYNPNDIRVGWILLMIPGAEVDPDDITPPPTAPPASEEPAD